MCSGCAVNWFGVCIIGNLGACVLVSFESIVGSALWWLYVHVHVVVSELELKYLT